MEPLTLATLTSAVYVLASDTRVEAPCIGARIRKELETLQAAAKRDHLPLTTHLVFPKLNDAFWVNLIGPGYPSPNTHFRWCTDRLKIHREACTGDPYHRQDMKNGSGSRNVPQHGGLIT